MKPVAVNKTVWFSPTARRHYLTKRAACTAEARAKIKAKYPSEESQQDSEGRTWDEGWHCSQLKRYDELLRRLARVIMRATK